jgi:hypothetical protein
MGLVYCKEGDVSSLEPFCEMRHRKPLRCDIQQLYPVVFEHAIYLSHFTGIHRTVHKSRLHAVFNRSVHLVFHQGNERTDDYNSAVHQCSRELVAQGFTASSGHHGKDIPLAEDVSDDGFLIRTEGLKTKDSPECIGYRVLICFGLVHGPLY